MRLIYIVREFHPKYEVGCIETRAVYTIGLFQVLVTRCLFSLLPGTWLSLAGGSLPNQLLYSFSSSILPIDVCFCVHAPTQRNLQHYFIHVYKSIAENCSNTCLPFRLSHSFLGSYPKKPSIEPPIAFFSLQKCHKFVACPRKEKLFPQENCSSMVLETMHLTVF